jgi:hypothetical protein
MAKKAARKRAAPKKAAQMQDAMDALLKAVTDPTEEHVKVALEHPKLRKALDGLNPADFQEISKVVGPYLILKRGFVSPTRKNIASLSAHDQLRNVAKKLSPEDVKAIGAVMKATAASSNCGNQVCR